MAFLLQLNNIVAQLLIKIRNIL